MKTTTRFTNAADLARDIADRLGLTSAQARAGIAAVRSSFGAYEDIGEDDLAALDRAVWAHATGSVAWIVDVGGGRSAITDAQIESLQTAAGQAGDNVMAAICERALGGEITDYAISDMDRARVERLTVEAARAECAAVIVDAAGR